VFNKANNKHILIDKIAFYNTIYLYYLAKLLSFGELCNGQYFSEVFSVAFEEIFLNHRGVHYGKFLCPLEGFVMAKF